MDSFDHFRARNDGPYARNTRARVNNVPGSVLAAFGLKCRFSLGTGYDFFFNEAQRRLSHARGRVTTSFGSYARVRRTDTKTETSAGHL